MKKKIWIPIIAVVILLAVLFVPIPLGSYDDGGTREWVALTYKLVDWNRVTTDGIYEKTRVYFGADKRKSLSELWDMEYAHAEQSFIATIMEINGSTALVEPIEGEPERNSSDQFRISLGEISDEAKAGDVIKVTYTGGIMESYPAQVNTIRCEFAKDLRHMEYAGEWIDKTTATKYDGSTSEDLIITEIYADCFFAEYVIPMPYTVKINGVLSDDWCVGDQVLVTYNNRYIDEENNAEGDLESIDVSDFALEPDVDYKPVIYLYPEEEIEISVKLTLDGRLTCTYPAYNDGWTVTASPDGTLTDASGQIYNYLYWEGETYAEWDFRSGFCVKGEDTAAFLEDTLTKLGLTRREANEFIVYWLPLMQENTYNIISFQTDVYTESAVLALTPEPDTLIRVFMAYKASERYVEMPEQELTAPERVGFTVVEWGGTAAK